jgi:hypothetical protein
LGGLGEEIGQIRQVMEDDLYSWKKGRNVFRAGGGTMMLAENGQAGKKKQEL